jgi:hypothetical protein
MHMPRDEVVLRPPPDLVQHRQMSGAIGFQWAGVQAERLVAHRHQPGAGLRVGAGERCDLMTEVDERIG